MRYCRRDAPYMVWEVIAAHAGTDGKRYVVQVNLSDPTWRKTLSLAELTPTSPAGRLPWPLSFQPAPKPATSSGR
jgi:hypothetical protein